MPPYIKNTLLNFFSFFLIAFSLYIFVSLVSYDVTDSGFYNKNSNEVINNLGGPLGASISDFIFTLIGFGGYLLLLVGSIWAVQTLLVDDKYKTSLKTVVRFLSSIFLILSFCAIGEFYFSDSFGGLIGAYLFNYLSSSIGNVGALIFLVVLGIPATSFAFNFSWINTMDSFGKILILSSSFAFEALKKLLIKINSILKNTFSNISSFIKLLSDKATEKKEIKNSKPKISSEPQIK